MNRIRHILLGFFVVLSGTSLAFAAENGTWYKSGPHVQINAACTQVYACKPKTALIIRADSYVAVSKPKMVYGVCSAGGGAIDSCNACLTSPPTDPCVWSVRSK